MAEVNREENFKEWLSNVREQIKKLKEKEKLSTDEKLRLRKLRKLSKRILEEI